MIKVGQEVICKPVSKLNHHGGAGYRPGRVFTVTKITQEYGGKKSILWGEKEIGGVYKHAVELTSKSLLTNIVVKINEELNSDGSRKNTISSRR